MRELLVSKNDSGQRLDKFMEKRFKTMPLALLYKYIRLKCVRVNGQKVREGSYMLKEGDLLNFYISDEFFGEKKKDNDLEGIRPSFTVVYEDENILLADKPVGLLCQGDVNETRNTLINHIKVHLINKGEYDLNNDEVFAPALCNRIDKNTQGIVIAAKNAEALRILNEKIKLREVEKHYICLVWGKPEKEKDTLVAYLKKDSVENHVHIIPSQDVNMEYKKIITSYELIESKEDISKLRINLLTGRTHQIRAHMAFIGHPLVGDTKYGTIIQNKNSRFKYQALSSCEVLFAFKSDAGLLNYLKDKCFSIIPFFEREDW